MSARKHHTVRVADDPPFGFVAVRCGSHSREVIRWCSPIQRPADTIVLLRPARTPAEEKWASGLHCYLKPGGRLLVLPDEAS